MRFSAKGSVGAVCSLLLAIVMWLGLCACAGAQETYEVRAGAGKPPGIDESFVTARVKNVTEPALNEALLKGTGIVTKRQMVEVEVLEGPLKGKTILIPNELTDNPAYNIVPEPGKEVVVSVVSEQGKKPEINIADYNRAPFLGILFALFLAVYLYFGGKSGLKSLLGLVVAGALVGFVLLPMSLQGFDPLLVSAGISLIVTVATIAFVGGWSKKSAAAVLGTIGGIIIAGVSSHWVIMVCPLTGLSSEEAQILRGSILHQSPTFFSGLLAAGMLIGALGVIMDVAVSIASATWEVSQTDTSLSRKALYEKGMNVGRDIMGTMTNTLILAYAGSALPLLLLMSAVPSPKLLNLDLVATEVASALTGSLGLICTIPLTALAAARLMGHHPAQKTSLAGGATAADADDQLLFNSSGEDGELSRLASLVNTDEKARR